MEAKFGVIKSGDGCRGHKPRNTRRKKRCKDRFLPQSLQEEPDLLTPWFSPVKVIF
jgi:hypothetical protein